MFLGHILTSPLLFISLLLLHLGVANSLCLPCYAMDRRMSAWDAPLARALRLVSRSSSSPGNNDGEKITNPTNSTVWTMGSDVVVTWMTDAIYDKAGVSTGVNRNGTLLLGSVKAGSGEEYLDIEHPLATDFEMKKGFVDFECPKVEPHNHDYFVTFLHDTKNRSPIFSIRK
ncbi:hypothetical protein BJ165DRAFT_1190697 [Panaeolus papilionaceus]|nr:hypothetical protein BJ165DRAFT_1190697 [Panaeolus papilionaceus]